jgi:hypothetical protein
MMRRVQIQLDERTYEAMRRRAFERRQSLAAAIRELLQERLEARPRKRRLTMKDFPWIGAIKTGKRDNVSERHDEILGEGPW